MSNLVNDNQLYMILGEIRGDLKSVVNSLGTMRNDHRQLREDVEKIKTQHNERIHQLEKFRWKIAGIALFIPFVVTAFGWYVGSIT